MGMTPQDRREMREVVTGAVVAAVDPLCERIDELRDEVRGDANKTQELSETVAELKGELKEKSRTEEIVHRGLAARIGRCEGVIRWAAYLVIGSVIAGILSLLFVGLKGTS